MSVNSSGIMIRRAVPLDCSNIVRLIRASWETSPAVRLVQVNDQRTIEYVASTLKDGFVIVADLSGRLVGALACAPMRERWSETDDWFLCDEFVVIDSHWTTRGIGELLINEAETFAKQEEMPLLFGGNLLNQSLLDRLIKPRPHYQHLGAHYLHIPQAMGHETLTSMPETATAN